MVAEYNQNLMKKSRPWRPTYPNSLHLTTRPATDGDTGPTENREPKLKLGPHYLAFPQAKQLANINH